MKTNRRVAEEVAGEAEGEVGVVVTARIRTTEKRNVTTLWRGLR